MCTADNFYRVLKLDGCEHFDLSYPVEKICFSLICKSDLEM